MGDRQLSKKPLKPSLLGHSVSVILGNMYREEPNWDGVEAIVDVDFDVSPSMLIRHSLLLVWHEGFWDPYTLTHLTHDHQIDTCFSFVLTFASMAAVFFF